MSGSSLLIDYRCPISSRSFIIGDNVHHLAATVKLGEHTSEDTRLQAIVQRVPTTCMLADYCTARSMPRMQRVVRLLIDA